MKPPRNPQVRQDLRNITLEGATYCIMSGGAEYYLPAFVLAATGSPVASGLINTLPRFLGSLLQAPSLLRKVGSLRTWSVAVVIVQALVLLSLGLFTSLGTLPVGLIFAGVSLHYCAGYASGPAWNTWMDTILPRPLRAQFFGRRNALCNLVQWASILSAGLLLQKASDLGSNVLTIFAGIFLAAGAARLAGAYFMSRQSEPVRLPSNYRVHSYREAFELMRRSGEARLLQYMLAAQVALEISNGFTAAYLLAQQHLPYWQFTLILSSCSVARILALPRLGKLLKNMGSRAMFRTSGLGLAALPLFWTLPGMSFLYYLALQAATGVLMGAFELAGAIVQMEAIPARDRTSVLTRFNVVSTAAGLLGTALGGWILSLLGQSQLAYVALFVAAAALRLGALRVLPAAPKPSPFRTIQARQVPANRLLRHVGPPAQVRGRLLTPRVVPAGKLPLESGSPTRTVSSSPFRISSRGLGRPRRSANLLRR